jgi:hypothetical protein
VALILDIPALVNLADHAAGQYQRPPAPSRRPSPVATA